MATEQEHDQDSGQDQETDSSQVQNLPGSQDQSQNQNQADSQNLPGSQNQSQDQNQDDRQNLPQDQNQDDSQNQSQDQNQDDSQNQPQVQGQTAAQSPPQASFRPDENHQHQDHIPLADELGIADIYDPMVGKDGKVYCTAGRDAPIAEFTDQVLILHPPQMPLDASNAGEEFSLRVDERGILLDELGSPKKIPAATYRGCPIFLCGEQVPGTLKHYVVAIAHDGGLHAIFFDDGERLTSYDVYDLRNRSAQGDLSEFPEVRCDIE